MPQRGRQRKRDIKTPPSRQAEHRRINDIIHEVNYGIRKFNREHFEGKSIDYHACSECMDKLLEEWEMDKDSLSTWKEFVDITNTKIIDKKTKRSQQFKTLLHLCHRARDFELMVPVMRNKLVSCVNDHMYKYCLSFEEDSRPHEVTPIKDYEAAIASHKVEIDEKLNAVNHSILRYGELKSPFYKFVFEGQEHGTLMEDITATFSEISEMLKKWVQDDASYPEKLNQEIQFNNSYKEKLQNDIATLHDKKSHNSQQIDKMQRSRVKLEKEYNIYKQEKIKTKRRLETVELKIERLGKEREASTEKLEEQKGKRGQKNSPREKSDIDRQIDKCQRDLELLDERERPMKRQRSRLKKEHKEVSDRTYELKVEVVTLRHKQFELRKEMDNIDVEISSIQERIASIDQKTDVIRKIRDMKLLPTYLRKRHLEKRNEPLVEDKLQDACQYVAHSIGDDWKRLYDRLPFIPSRDGSRRQRDVEIMDLIAAKRDRTTEEQAQQSLEKWRWFNRQGDVGQLIKTLRKMHKVDIARKLENKFMIENVYG
ncbi:myosin heavy chain, cardiac muscle isoform-like [Haliotis asinina]|uniref:myosin heavy chain, cardiac muscle isoform-like n=1 Tax=Haliotis asinina TaxID=109174 RepID=UPI00353194E2